MGARTTERRTSRAARTPKNPNGVAVGQLWERTDDRDRERFTYLEPRRRVARFVVGHVNLRAGVATVYSTSGPRKGIPKQVRLDRFSPKHHYRLISS